MRDQIKAFVEAATFQRVIITLIVINGIVLGLEAIPEMEQYWGPALQQIDFVILWVFVAEIILRLIAHGPRFFRDPWSVFDFLVVAVSLSAVSGLAALRAFRVFRVLRTLNAFPSLRRVIGTLLAAIPGVTNVGIILLLILFVASVIATELFGEGLPDLFGSLFISMFTLFKIMTLEGWPDIADDTLKVYPYAWIFFIVYILVATLTVFNLFVAVIVSASEAEGQRDDTRAAQADEKHAEILKELRALRAEVDRLRS